MKKHWILAIVWSFGVFWLISLSTSGMLSADSKKAPSKEPVKRVASSSSGKSYGRKPQSILPPENFRLPIERAPAPAAPQGRFRTVSYCVTQSGLATTPADGHHYERCMDSTTPSPAQYRQMGRGIIFAIP